MGEEEDGEDEQLEQGVREMEDYGQTDDLRCKLIMSHTHFEHFAINMILDDEMGRLWGA